MLKLTEKTKSKYDDLAVKSIQPAVFRLFLIIAIRFLFDRLGLLIKYVNNIIDSIIILAIFDFIIRLVDYLIEIWTEKLSRSIVKGRKLVEVHKSLGPLFHKISKFVLLLTCLIFVLHEWNINVTPLLGGLGIAGLALSLAAKETLENIFGGIALIFDKSFKVGDRVDIQSLGVSGVILDIGLRSTKVRTWDNEVYIIPNGKLSQAVIRNLNLPDPKARVVVPFSVEYGSDPEKVKKVVLKEIKKIESVIDDPAPTVIFSEMGDFALKFEAKFWVADVSQRYSAKLEAIERIYKALYKNKIGIPFPTHTVYLRKKK